MAEMNGRMNGSQYFPPPALCLRFQPALQACTEDLPLVLQRPDSFPLVMGILQEINHDKVGSSSRADNTCLVSQRPRNQQIQALALSKVKLENLDIEDHHQHSYNSNPDLYQEWSLKGVEELLTDSQELQLRHDCYQQAHEAAAHLELASARDEKPLFDLQSTHSQFNQRSSDEAQLLVDEKPALCSQLPNSLKEQEPRQGRVEAFSEAKPGPHALQAAVLANNKPHQQPSQACAEISLGLDNLQVVKREPEGNACCSEAQMQDLPAVCTSRSSEVGLAKENIDRIISRQSKDKITSNMDTELNKSRKTTLLGHKSQARNVLLSGLPEEGGAQPKLKDKMTMNADCELNKLTLPESDLQLNLDTGVTKRWTVHNILRSTSAILALPAKFTEQEKSLVPQKPPPTVKSLAEEGPMDPTVCSEGVDSPQVSTDFKGDRKHQAVSSEADLDLCELTLSLGSSQPQTAMCPKNLDCHALCEEKPVVKNFFVQEECHGQCQRTNPNQWHQATSCGSYKVFSTPAYYENPLFSPAEKSKLVKGRTDGEGSIKVMRTTSEIFGLYDSSPDEPEKEPLFKQGQPSSPVGNHITVNNSCLDGGVSRRTLRLMPQSSEDGGSAVEKGEAEEFASEDDQLAEPNQKIPNVQLSQVSSQSEQASEFNEPHKKRMRGTLPIEEEGDGAHKEKDTRCHRSDGKSWRCARECINGAYYCQYHLRARRIGYNRRKNRDTDTDHLESVSKKSSKSGKKSRQLLSTSTSNRNSKP